jgi:hypothetical protein
VILSHARNALQALISRINRLLELTEAFPVLTNMHPHPEIPSVLSDIAFQQGTASTIMFNDSPRSTRENARNYQLRLDRVKYIRDFCAKIELRVLPDRKVRNSLTHIDEYLARALTKPKTGWFIDVALSRRDEFTAQQYGIGIDFCRTYIKSENVILHLGHEISLSQLKGEAVSILREVWGEGSTKHPRTL